MTTVKIISGVYGYHPENSQYVIPTTKNDPAISVDDKEAKRLIDLGVAVYVGDTAVATAVPGAAEASTIDNSSGDGGGENVDFAPGEIDGHLDPETLKLMKMDNLKKLAADLGIDTAGIKKKDDLVAAIAAVEVSSDGPELEIEDVVE